jgi:hypothetical protein
MRLVLHLERLLHREVQRPLGMQDGYAVIEVFLDLDPAAAFLGELAHHVGDFHQRGNAGFFEQERRLFNHGRRQAGDMHVRVRHTDVAKRHRKALGP